MNDYINGDNRMTIFRRIKQFKIIVAIYENLWSLFIYCKIKIEVIVNRIKFPINEKKKLKALKDKYKGQRCFIVATGPSQNVRDLEMIKDEMSITVNSAYMIYPNTEWRPTFYANIDGSERAYKMLIEAMEVYPNYLGVFCDFEQKQIDNFDNIFRFVGDASNLFMIDSFWNKHFPKLFPVAKFSKDISKKVYCGKTVVYAVIQIMAYMGFKDIYLSGVDCNYNQETTHCEGMSYDIDAEGIERIKKSSGYKMKIQLEAMADIIKKMDVNVYNATRGGMLEGFERVDLDSILKK